MSKFEHSFDTIFEAFWNRATTGCFTAGDVVTFDSSKIKKHPDYESLTASMKTRLDNMMETSEKGETVIVVTDVTLGGLNGSKAPMPSNLTIAYSQGGGRWIEPLTIPGSLTEFMNPVEAGVNLVDKIPASSKIEYPATTEAEEVDLKELEKNRTKGNIKSIHGESWQRKNPSKLNIDDYGIDKNGGRYGDGIYAKIHVDPGKIEDFMQQCRTDFGLKNGAEPNEKWDGFSQPFLKAAKNIMLSKGDKGLISYFSKFADFVLKRLPKWEYITNELPTKNSKIDKWNTDRSNELGKAYNSKEIDYHADSLTYIKANWKRYWDWDSSDVHECGGALRRSYAANAEQKGGSWGDAYKHFIELTKIFIEKI